MGRVAAAALVILVDAVWLFPDRLPGRVLPVYVAAIGLVFALRARTPVGALLAALGLAAVSGGPLALLVWSGFHAGHRVAASRPGAAVALAGMLGYAGARIAERGMPVPAIAAECVVLLALPLAAGAYLAQHRRLVDALDEHNRRLLRERELLAERERLQERLRIARDVHDSLGHRLGLVSLQAAALEAGEPSDRERGEALRLIADASRQAVDELHELVGALRRPPEPAGPAHGPADVDALVEGFRAAGMPVALSTRGRPGELDGPAGEAVYRVVEEGLTNAARHAPGRPVTVSMEWEPGALLLSVGNELPAGPVPQVDGRGHGLAGLAERVGLAGGLLNVERSATCFRLRALIPAAGDAMPEPEPAGAGALRRIRFATLVLAAAALLSAVGPAGTGGT